jgi:hypothetical protein
LFGLEQNGGGFSGLAPPKELRKGSPEVVKGKRDVIEPVEVEKRGEVEPVAVLMMDKNEVKAEGAASSVRRGGLVAVVAALAVLGMLLYL